MFWKVLFWMRYCYDDTFELGMFFHSYCIENLSSAQSLKQLRCFGKGFILYWYFFNMMYLLFEELWTIFWWKAWHFRKSMFGWLFLKVVLHWFTRILRSAYDIYLQPSIKSFYWSEFFKKRTIPIDKSSVKIPLKLFLQT